uniref:Uncharacterized protein n=1 Tax=Rhizophora mucronata TaxID=61149 RepID=A0A2P2LMB1_RHIMU
MSTHSKNRFYESSWLIRHSRALFSCFWVFPQTVGRYLHITSRVGIRKSKSRHPPATNKIKQNIPKLLSGILEQRGILQTARPKDCPVHLIDLKTKMGNFNHILENYFI